MTENVHWNGNERLVVRAENDKIIERAEKRKRKNIKELSADFHGEYTPVEMDWGEPVGEEVW